MEWREEKETSYVLTSVSSYDDNNTDTYRLNYVVNINTNSDRYG